MVLDVEDMREDLRILSSGFDAGAGAGLSGEGEGEGEGAREGGVHKVLRQKETQSKGVRPGDRSGKEMVQDMCGRVMQLVQTVAAKVPGGEAAVERAMALGSDLRGGGEKTDHTGASLDTMVLTARKCPFSPLMSVSHFAFRISHSILSPYRDVRSRKRRSPPLHSHSHPYTHTPIHLQYDNHIGTSSQLDDALQGLNPLVVNAKAMFGKGAAGAGTDVDTDSGRYGGYAAEAMAEVEQQARDLIGDHLQAMQQSMPPSDSVSSADVELSSASSASSSFGRVLGDMVSTPPIDYASAVRGGEVFLGEDVGYARVRPTTSPSFVSGIGYGSRLRFATQLSKLGKEPMVVLSTAAVRVGGCYAMPGSAGQMTIVLSQKVIVDSVEIVHAPDDAALPWATTSALKGFSVKGWKSRPGEGGRKVQTALDMGDFEFSPSADISSTDRSADRAIIDKEVSQSFVIAGRTRLPVSAVTISFDSNNGHPDYTCMYRVRVHGTPQSAD